MLSLGKLAPGQQQYCLDNVARGAEEYYTGEKEAPGQWVGSAAGQLGLEGEVDADALGRVLEHVHPEDGLRLTAARSVPMVAGFDVTFCAPKSVSLLFALGEPEVSNEVRNAADAAIAASLEVLERAACRVRRGRGGRQVLDADGFVAAAFRHRTSRAADPHLHTHVVIANLAHTQSDDRWTALDARSSAREHAYTALSRGRRGNDVFVAVNDHRIDERHATEVEVDALDVLHSLGARSVAQRFALDQVDASTTRLDSMRHERDVLRQRIGQGPADRGREFRELKTRRQQEERYRSEAHWRLDVAQKELDKLGPIGRRTHRRQRREIQDRIARFEGDFAGHEEKLGQLERKLDALAPKVISRAAWERQNRVDLDRLASLDRRIDAVGRHSRAAARGLDCGVEHDLGMEL